MRYRRVAYIVVPSVVLLVALLCASLGRSNGVEIYTAIDLPRVVNRTGRTGFPVRVILSTPYLLKRDGNVVSYSPGAHPLYPPSIEFHFREPPPASFSSVVGTVSEFRPDLRPRLSRVPGVVVVTDCAAE